MTDQNNLETTYRNSCESGTSSGSDAETSSSEEEKEEIDSENMSDSDCEKRLLGSESVSDEDSNAWDSEDWDESSEDDELTEAVEQALQIQITHPPITAREVRTCPTNTHTVIHSTTLKTKSWSK